MEPDWENIYLQLYSFAHQLLKAHHWFRSKKTDSYLEGKQPHDYAMDAIEKYLREPGKYDSAKRTLSGYLKYHILRQIIGNDSTSLENKKTKDVFAHQDDDEEGDMLSLLLPHSKTIFDQEIDFNKIMQEIEESVNQDLRASQIFEGTGRDRLKRREVIEEYNMSSTDYDNGMKRLKTELKRVIQKYNIDEPKWIKKKEANLKST